jgi:hypothetical protein
MKIQGKHDAKEGVSLDQWITELGTNDVTYKYLPFTQVYCKHITLYETVLGLR